ncbi:MAG: glycosyl hydrolase [Bacteroidota bacterium]
MKLRIILLLLIGLTACTEHGTGSEKISSWKKFRSEFTDPSAGYKTVPFWAWNGEVTEKMIDRELADFKAHGLGGVIVHPRYGMITEYLSDDYFNLVKYTVEKADRLGMKVWLYDENSYPSGFAGGHVPAEMPESVNDGAMLRQTRQSVLQMDTLAGWPVILRKSSAGFEDISARSKEFSGIPGDYYLYERVSYPKSGWFAGFSYVDLLKPGVTEEFIRLTMEGYKNSVGQYFGRTIPGIFTDEPHISPSGSGLLIRWTPDLFDRFRQRWGYDLQTSLPLLFDNSGDYRKVRYDYFKLLLELFIERWSLPWNAYVEKENLQWTGHYWEHTWPDPYHGGDHMAMAAWHQVPGIDLLFNNRDVFPEQFGNIRSVKELRSIANQMGRVRTLSETYGGSGWELSFEDMKVNGDWEYVLGVNLMNQHLAYQSIVGDRKHDYPQSFSSHEPWWDEYSTLAMYFARLSVALSSGRQVNHILVIEPTSTAWMYAGGPDQQEKLNRLNSGFGRLLETLEAAQVEYDLGSEEIIQRFGKTGEGLLEVGECSYNLVILPEGLENLSSGTGKLLGTYLESGGDLVSLGPLPAYCDGSLSYEFTDWQKFSGENLLLLNGTPDPRLNELTPSEEFSVVESDGGPVFHHRRELNEGQILFLVNTDRENAASTRWNMIGKDLLLLDPMTGRISTYPCVQSDNTLSFSVNLPPSASLLLFVSDHEIRRKDQPETGADNFTQEAALAGFVVSPGSGNMLPLDYCIITSESVRNDTCFYYDAARKIYNEYGFAQNPWSSSIQFRKEILDLNKFGKGTGFTASYLFRVDSSLSGNASVRMALEQPWFYSVCINDQEIEAIKGEHWIDEGIGVFDLSGKLVPGENRFTIKVEPMNLLCEVAPVILLGDFSVNPSEEGWVLSAAHPLQTGSWKDQGYPFYSGYVDYSVTMICSRTGNPVKLIPGDWKGTVGAVFVNGREAGQVFTDGDEVRLDPFLEKGSNVITLRIYGSLKNIFGPFHLNPTRGFASPWDFRKAPDHQPPASEYDLLDYGLYTPFRVVVASS